MCHLQTSFNEVTNLFSFKFSLTTLIDFAEGELWCFSKACTAKNFEWVAGSQAAKKVPAGHGCSLRAQSALLCVRVSFAFTFSSPARVNPIWLCQARGDV